MGHKSRTNVLTQPHLSQSQRMDAATVFLWGQRKLTCILFVTWFCFLLQEKRNTNI